MHVTVLICTWNNCLSLRSTLQSLQELIVPHGLTWELVVVNNNCTDGTDDVLQEFEQLLPLRRVFESVPGVSRARNTGTSHARGALLLFTDDDVQVDRNWMSALVKAADDSPHHAYFGGAIRPLFEPGVPNWVKRYQSTLTGMLCTLDRGPETRSFTTSDFPYGPNMAVRREALCNAAFDENVGRKGNEQIRGCESSLFLALEKAGATGGWVPEAVVHHRIPANRATLGYLWKYYYGSGQYGVRMKFISDSFSRRNLFVRCAKSLVRMGMEPRRWPRHLTDIARAAGQYAESKRLVAQQSAPGQESAEPLKHN